jgi:hypothetical protein
MTNNNPPPMPERIWALEMASDFEPGAYAANAGHGGTEYLRADLSHYRLTDEEVENFKYTNLDTKINYETGYANGWNNCIDHLRQRGII